MVLIELFASFICLDQVCNRPLMDNLLPTSRLPGFVLFLFFSMDGLCLGTNQNKGENEMRSAAPNPDNKIYYK